MTSNDFCVNACEPRYIPQLVELWKEYIVDQGDDPITQYIDFDAGTDGFSRILEGYMSKEPEGFLVATVSDEVVGFLIAFRNALSDNYVMKRRVGKIQVVHVKRGFRRRGIASSLLREAIDYLGSSGCSVVLAETGEDNMRSMRMLTKLGFKLRGKLVTLIQEL